MSLRHLFSWFWAHTGFFEPQFHTWIRLQRVLGMAQIRFWTNPFQVVPVWNSHSNGILMRLPPFLGAIWPRYTKPRRKISANTNHATINVICLSSFQLPTIWTKLWYHEGSNVNGYRVSLLTRITSKFRHMIDPGNMIHSPAMARNSSGLRFNIKTIFVVYWFIEGILTKGPYLPCVSMTGRALWAGCPRHIITISRSPERLIFMAWIPKY